MAGCKLLSAMVGANGWVQWPGANGRVQWPDANGRVQWPGAGNRVQMTGCNGSCWMQWQGATPSAGSEH